MRADLSRIVEAGEQAAHLAGQLLNQSLGHLGVAPSEEAGAEIDDVDNVLRCNAGQLFGDQLGRGPRPRHRLGISYHDNSHACSQQGADFPASARG